MTALVELPDIEQYYKILDEIMKLELEVSKLKLNLKLEEARIVSEASNNPKYYINGKPPSISYITETYLVTGFEGELIKLREQLLTTEAALNYKERQYELYKLLADIWRTQSANERLKF